MREKTRYEMKYTKVKSKLGLFLIKGEFSPNGMFPSVVEIKNLNKIFTLSEPDPRAKEFELRAYVPKTTQIAPVYPNISFSVFFHV